MGGQHGAVEESFKQKLLRIMDIMEPLSWMSCGKPKSKPFGDEIYQPRSHAEFRDGFWLGWPTFNKF